MKGEKILWEAPKSKSERDIIQLFRSGNFTIVYWDNSEPTFYKGKWDYNKEYEKDDYKEMEKNKIEIPMYNMNGYLPDVVDWLVKALKGKADSI